MFHGSIPADMQAMIGGAVVGWRCADVYVGCSGNFTVERVLAPLGRFMLHSNDVSIHSYALGQLLCGQAVDLTLKPETLTMLPWLAEYMETDAERVATLLLAGRFVSAIGNDGIKHNAYYQRLIAAYHDQWERMHEVTSEKMSEVTLALASYANEDVMSWIERVPDDAGFISYPPFFGASMAYERDFARLDQLFEWPKPTYKPLDDSSLQRFFEVLTGREYWAFGSNRVLDEYAPYLSGVTKTTNRAKPIYLYASSSPKRIVSPRQETPPVPQPRLMPGMRIGERMTIAELYYPYFQSLRSQYMHIGIRPGSATSAYGVMVDGLLIGVYAFSTAPTQSAAQDIYVIYMLSDFPVRPTDYPHLAKLVLYAATSKESKLLAERTANRRIREVMTTAFSKNPVSMKYRGIFDLYSRKENHVEKSDYADGVDLETNEYYRRPYALNYSAKMGQWTLGEALEIWKKKYGRVQSGNQSHSD